MIDADDFKKGKGCYAIVFPGQGSQYSGMGKELAESFPKAYEVFKSAEKATRLPIKRLSFSGTEDELRATDVTQPCILATNIAIYTAFKHSLPTQEPKFVCGHSAGEYAALVAGGALSFSDSISLIRARGSLMARAKRGGMAAIIGIDLETVEDLCEKSVVSNGTLGVANINSSSQVVVSGDNDSIESIIMTALEKNIKCVPLPVSGAFHSPLMREAAIEFSEALSLASFKDASIPIVSNVTGQPVNSAEEWVRLLESQITSTVLWKDSIRYIHQQGVEIFVEVGPSRVLSKLIEATVDSATVLNVEDLDSLHSTISVIESRKI